MGEGIIFHIVVFIFVIALMIIGWVFAYRKGVRILCPNCGQRQIGWSTQCPRCSVVFKEWED